MNHDLKERVVFEEELNEETTVAIWRSSRQRWKNWSRISRPYILAEQSRKADQRSDDLGKPVAFITGRRRSILWCQEEGSTSTTRDVVLSSSSRTRLPFDDRITLLERRLENYEEEKVLMTSNDDDDEQKYGLSESTFSLLVILHIIHSRYRLHLLCFLWHFLYRVCV